MKLTARVGGRSAALLLAATAALTSVSAGLAPAAQAATTTPVCDPTCLLDYRTGAHTDYDRVVLDFSGPVPPLNTIVQNGPDSSPLTYPASGNEVHITGSSYMSVTIPGVSIVDTKGAGTYVSPTLDNAVGLPSVKGCAFMGNFENEITFGLALGTFSSVKISTLTSPSRVVIDVYH
ncbi:hypothetical protein [Streptomyces sp. NPDC018610]|uniref:AMIN-like domain-containing (lipo)protein n=1 Tax=Streptomyces sp. NPDC018610 TaxID=3365049 RepID=UPI00379B1DF8